MKFHFRFRRSGIPTLECLHVLARFNFSTSQDKFFSDASRRFSEVKSQILFSQFDRGTTAKNNKNHVEHCINGSVAFPFTCETDIFSLGEYH